MRPGGAAGSVCAVPGLRRGPRTRRTHVPVAFGPQSCAVSSRACPQNPEWPGSALPFLPVLPVPHSPWPMREQHNSTPTPALPPGASPACEHAWGPQPAVGLPPSLSTALLVPRLKRLSGEPPMSSPATVGLSGGLLKRFARPPSGHIACNSCLEVRTGVWEDALGRFKHHSVWIQRSLVIFNVILKPAI